MATLTSEQIVFFQEQGYALSRQQLFAPEKFAELQAIFEEQLALKGAKLSDELDTPHFRDERLLRFLLSDEVLDLVEPLIGPNMALWSSHFICKDPYTGRATPWHEDSAFWKGRCSAYDKIVTVWLAIDRSTRENGCMQVIPAAHLDGGFSEYIDADTAQNTFAEQIKSLIYLVRSPSSYSRGSAPCMMGGLSMERMPIPARSDAAVTPCATSPLRSMSIPNRIGGTGSGWPVGRIWLEIPTR